MNAPEIAALLGLASTDGRVEGVLQRHRVDERPQLVVDDADADGPVLKTQDWVGSPADGIEFGFEEEASFLGLDPSDRGASPMLLTEVYFYGDHHTMRPYAGPLPFGLSLSEGRAATRGRLARLEGTRRSYVRDTWEPEGFRMTVAYTDDGARIAFVVCMLRYDASPPFEGGAREMPSIDNVVALFGKRWDDPALREAFVPLGLDRKTREGIEPLLDFRATYGFELHFAARAPGPGAWRSPDRVLAQIVCFRDRERDARGWRGELPFGIAFDDSPEDVERKAGRPPDDRSDLDFTGLAVWHAEAFSVCVDYSTMENLVLRVRVMAPGEWEAYVP